MDTRRLESIGKPGIWLDSGPTGVGKSTADEAAMEVAAAEGYCLSLQPTHENVQEVVTSMKCRGLSVSAYPVRTTNSKYQNCWNPDADDAARLGLSALIAVCQSGCEHREKCRTCGFLFELEHIDKVPIVVGTHALAIHKGLRQLTHGRSYISIHEDCLDVLAPQHSLPAGLLEPAQYVVTRLINDPYWLNQFGPTTCPGDDPKVIARSERRSVSRTQVHSYLLHLNEVLNSLVDHIALVDQGEVELPRQEAMDEPSGIHLTLFRACRELKIDFGEERVWGFLFRLASGDYERVGVIVHGNSRSSRQRSPREGYDFDNSGPHGFAEVREVSSQNKRLILTRRNCPNRNATVWLNDATGDLELLREASGLDIIDATPEGHLPHSRSIVQFPVDITRTSSKARLRSLVRGVLLARPECRQVGIITHSTLKEGLNSLGAGYADRVAAISHFGSGDDRGSNAWLEKGCDLLIIAGTPRINDLIVKELMHRCGRFDDLNRGGDWGDLVWLAHTPSGSRRPISARGYRDLAWRQVHQAKVRAAIIQAAGRARPLQDDGCDVVILSTEECSYPVVDIGDEITPVTDDDVAALSALSELLSLISYREEFRCAKTSEVAERIGVSSRQAQKRLVRLCEIGLVERIGERGGWRLRSFCGGENGDGRSE